MRAGLLRHRIEIQNPTDVADGQGGYTRTWAMALKTWAMIRPLSGKEQVENQQVSPKISSKVTMRYNDKITHKSQIKYGTRTLQVIPPVSRDEMKREITVLCEEITD